MPRRRDGSIDIRLHMTHSTTRSEDLYSGLATLNWSLYDEPTADYAFYRDLLLGSIPGGYRTLEIGCGCGRLLRRYLREGIPVDGCDASSQMLAVCRTRIAAEGMNTQLFHQPAEFLSLPGQYAMIYIPCSTLLCIPSPQAAAQAIARCAAHLIPGGIMAMNIHAPDTAPLAGPSPWIFNNENWISGECIVRAERRVVATDFSNRVELEQHRYRLIRNGSVIAEENRFGSSRWHTAEEVAAWLAHAGMGDIRLSGDFRFEPFDPARHRMLVITARRFH